MKDLGFLHRYIPGDSPTTLLLLHGTGGDEEDLIPIGKALLPEAGLLSPRGKVLERGMPRFFRRLAEGVFDIEDLKFRTHELAQFVEDARKEYGIKGKIYAAGYSNGANVAASMMLLRPDVLAGGALLRSMVPLVPEIAPDLKGVQVLLAGGRRDPIISPSGTIELEGMFQSAGAEVSVHWHEGGHELGQDDIDAARQWFEKL